jgi:hypothetical protein
VAIASISWRQAIGSPISANTFAAASRALSLSRRFFLGARLPSADLGLGFLPPFLAASFAVFLPFVVMVTLPFCGLWALATNVVASAPWTQFVDVRQKFKSSGGGFARKLRKKADSGAGRGIRPDPRSAVPRRIVHHSDVGEERGQMRGFEISFSHPLAGLLLGYNLLGGSQRDAFDRDAGPAG